MALGDHQESIPDFETLTSSFGVWLSRTPSFLATLNVRQPDKRQKGFLIERSYSSLMSAMWLDNLEPLS